MRRAPSFVVLALFVSLAGCGWTVGSARETAAQKTCAFYDRCGEIHSGQTYATMDDCMTKQRANWLDTWPSSSCDGKINAANLDVCLKAIDATTCNNLVDFIATASKCGRDKVCQ